MYERGKLAVSVGKYCNKTLGSDRVYIVDTCVCVL